MDRPGQEPRPKAVEELLPGAEIKVMVNGLPLAVGRVAYAFKGLAGQLIIKADIDERSGRLVLDVNPSPPGVLPVYNH